MPILEEDDVFRMKPYLMSEKEWKKAVVTKRLDHRSYKVATEHGLFRHDLIDLKKTQDTNVHSHKASSKPCDPKQHV